MIARPDPNYLAARGLLGCLLLSAAAAAARADDALPLQERYVAVQSAFLKEEFASVVRLVRPLTGSDTGPLAAALGVPGQAELAVRIWLWYALSLERQQRSSDALRAIDDLKTACAAMPRGRTVQPTAGAFWPEVLFWEGEISRRASKLGRAKLAYERLLEEFPESSWRAKAQLGLGLLMFQEEAYDAARRYAQRVIAEQPSATVEYEAQLLDSVCAGRLGRFSESVDRLQALLEQPLNSGARAQALVALGEAWDGAGNIEPALAAYRQAQQLAAGSLLADDAAFGIGWASFRHHRCPESLAALESYRPQAAGTQEKRLMAAFARGRCLMELGQEAKALGEFETLRAMDPEHELALEAALSIAELYERQQRFEEAVEMVDLVVRQAFSNAQQTQALIRWGSILLAQGDAAGAQAQFAHAEQLAGEPELRQAALNGRGDVEAFLSHPAEAMRCYEQARHLGAGTRGGLYAAYQVGRLHVRAQALDTAEAEFQQVIEGGDRELAGEARLALVFSYIARGNIDQALMALEAFESGGLLPQQTARANYYRALIAVQAGNIKEGETLCIEVVRAAPASDEALEAHLLMLDMAAAEVSREEAIRMLDRTWSDAGALPRRHRGRLANRLGDVADQFGDYDRAIAWYQIAWQEAPMLRSELDYRIASCYEEAGAIAKALERYQAIAQPPWTIRGQLAAAKLLEREERWAEAVSLYATIVQQGAPEAKFAQERMGALAQEGLLSQEQETATR